MKLIVRTACHLALLAALLTSAAGADTLDDVLKRGEIRVGVAEFAPWTIRARNGELIGFEVDLARKLAADMGVDAEFSVFPWNEIIAALIRGDIDIIAGGMAITPERALEVSFSRPVARSGVGIATNTEMTADIETFAGLDNKNVTIATAAETLANEVSRALFGNAEIRVFDDNREAEKAVLDGEAHAYLASMPEVVFLALRNPDVVDVPVEEPLVASAEALAVRRGDFAFLNFLDAWVTARQTDKWIPSTRDYWFNTLDWTERIGD